MTIRCTRASGRTVVALALAAVAIVALPAGAETGDREKPINYWADYDMTGNATAGHVVLRKNVRVVQGTTTINADELDLTETGDSFKAVASGAPVSFRTRSDNSDDFREAFAKKIVYDGKTGIIELFDDVLVRRGLDEQVGQYARYNMNSGDFTFGAKPGTPDSTPTPSRVRGVFMPKQEPAKGADGKASAKDAKGNDKAQAAKSETTAKTPAKPATPAPVADPVPLKSATDLSTTPR